MKQIDKPYIIKTYEEDEQEFVVIYLEDTRDNYMDKDALGKIGRIEIAKGYVEKIVNDDDLSNIEAREQVLSEAFQEIYGQAEIDLTSNIPYEIIKSMIADGTLETLGYSGKIKEKGQEYFDLGIPNQDDEFAEFNPDDELPDNFSLENIASTFRPRRRR